MLFLPSHVLSDFASKWTMVYPKLIYCESYLYAVKSACAWTFMIGVLGIGHRTLEILARVCQGGNLRSDRVLELWAKIFENSTLATFTLRPVQPSLPSKLWRLWIYRRHAPLHGHEAPLLCVKFDPRGELLVSE